MVDIRKKNLKTMQPSDVPFIRLMQKGPQSLSNPELLTILLGKDIDIKGKEKTAFELAHDIFQKYDIKRLSQASVGELDKISGVGKIRAAQVQAIFELARRLAMHTEDLMPVIETPKDVHEILGPEMRTLEQEQFRIILLDKRNKMIKNETVTIGILDTNLIHPREMFRSAIDNNASSVILVHNHPSGNPDPSEEDIKATKALSKASEIIGIHLQDHIILGDGSFFSMKAKGLF